MNLITLKNPADKNIVEFPVAEAEIINDEVRYDPNGNIITTGKTLLWSLDAGETKAFPEYVAKELLKVYEFLKEEKTIEGQVEEPKVGGKFVCKYCGQSFIAAKGIGLHLAIKHPEKL